MRRLTTQEFVERVRKVHGDRYDYSKVVYTSSTNKIVIVCPKHGKFLQAPVAHIRGNGCKQCAKASRISKQYLTHTEFVEKSRNVHGDKYDYSAAPYVASKVKMIITCPRHGEFLITPNAHLRGSGCKQCGIESSIEIRRHSKQAFMAKAREVHGNLYDYSEVIYTNNKTKVIIGCPDHGRFQQEAGNHMSGAGCPKCKGKSRRLGREEFIRRSRDAHGDKFDYSLVEYINSETNVAIICPEHGKFEQNPKSHYEGFGCNKCAGLNRKTTKEFIQEAYSVHGDLYDYSRVKYVNRRNAVQIGCAAHDWFWQSPGDHLRGIGCQKCGFVKTGKAITASGKERFFANAPVIHEGKYDYSQVKYVASDQKVTIICPDHGAFEQRPASHLMGTGCSVCGIEIAREKIQMSNDEFLERAKAIHGNRYDYGKAVYQGAHAPVTIICANHGEFEQRPQGHLRGAGCAICAGRKHTQESFLAAAQAIHGDKYDYCNTIYFNSKNKIAVTCPDHGQFYQDPSHHLQGVGCPTCGSLTGGGIDLSAPTILYYIRVDAGSRTLYKIGITNRTVRERFGGGDLERITKIRTWKFNKGNDAWTAEREVLEEYDEYRYRGPKILSQGGNTELFIMDVLGLDKSA